MGFVKFKKHTECWQSYPDWLTVPCSCLFLQLSLSLSVSSRLWYTAPLLLVWTLSTFILHDKSIKPNPSYVLCTGRIINKMVLAHVKSHKDTAVIPPLSQITTLTFTQHMVTICAVICQYNGYYSLPSRSSNYLHSLLWWVHWKIRQVSHSVWDNLRAKDKRIPLTAIFAAGGSIFLVPDSLICVSKTDMSRATTQKIYIQYNKRLCCSRPVSLSIMFHLVPI